MADIEGTNKDLATTEPGGAPHEPAEEPQVQPAQSLVVAINQEKSTERHTVSRVANAIKTRVLSVIDPIFEKMARGMVSTLQKLGLNPREHTIVEQAIVDKYTPALRNSTAMAVIAVPGIMLSSNSELMIDFCKVISGATCIAWFAMSLKEVKEKFINYGVELTRDMLKAFLTSTLLVAAASVDGMMNEQIQTALRWAQEAGIDIREIFNSPEIKTASVLTSVAVLINILRLFVCSVFKFDANDSMLAGSSDLAKMFYERSLSSLREAARRLKDPHELAAANHQIAMALSDYYEFLVQIKAALPEGLSKESISGLLRDSGKSQKQFDAVTLPILKSMLFQYRGLVSGEEAVQHRFDITLESIEELQRLYKEDRCPRQSQADMMISTILEDISELLRMFQDELIRPRTQMEAPKTRAQEAA